MIDRAVLKKLKQVDISKDKEKTKARVRELWTKLDKESRDKVLGLADIAKITVERTYKNGTITPKLTAAFASLHNINPFYITGESDSMDGYSEDVLLKFLKDKNAEKQRRKKVVPKKAAKADAPAEVKKAPQRNAAPAEGNTDADAEFKKQFAKVDQIIRILSKAGSLSADKLASLNNMPEEEIIYLIKAQLYRSKYSADADDITFFIKFLLTV